MAPTARLRLPAVGLVLRPPPLLLLRHAAAVAASPSPFPSSSSSSSYSSSSSRAAAAAAAAGAAVRTDLPLRRALHSQPARSARVVPVYGTGPPPEPPRPSAEYAAEERLARRRKQAEMLREGGGSGSSATGSGSSGSKSASGGGLRKRFWKEVHVREVDGALEVHLDSRPLRHPATKSVIRLPASKPLLAHALAVEWDTLVSAQQATKQHMIPLTSLVSRALDLTISPDSSSSSSSSSRDNEEAAVHRASAIQTLLRYLDTDSILCFSPHPEDGGEAGEGRPTLREQQEQAYADITGYLTTHLWPGTELRPALADDSIVPRPQPAETRAVVEAWMRRLSGFELAGLERATLAGKSLLVAARLVAEWSEEQPRPPMPASNNNNNNGGGRRFTIEDAARAVSLEVAWQTGRWGEVEDTHDVDREDLRRQLGSAVLLVSGIGTGARS